MPLPISTTLSQRFARQPRQYGPARPFRRRLRVRLRWIILPVVALFLIIGLVLAAHAKLLTIEHIDIRSQVTTKPMVVPVDQLRREVGVVQGRSLLFLDTKKLEHDWAKKFPAIGGLTVTKSYSHTLVVEYLPRIAICQLNTVDGHFLVDRNGLIFAKAESTSLPTLTAEMSQVKVGQSVSAQGVQLGLSVVSGLKVGDPKLESVVLHDDQLDVQLSGPPFIMIGVGHPSAEVLRDISVLLAKFKAESKYPRELDLRFDRPILRY